MNNVFDVKNKKILIVDDTKGNIDILVESLIDEYEIYVAFNGKEAIDLAHKVMPDIILLDIMMPEMNGYETLEILKASTETESIPVVFISALSEIENKTKGFSLGAVDYITKPFEIVEVMARVRNHLLIAAAKNYLHNQNRILEEKVRQRTAENEALRDAMIVTLASLAETRDPETGFHIKRTQHYLKIMALKLKEKGRYPELLTSDYIELMFKTAPLHDIGKVGIRDEILLKPGKLTPEEFEEMKKHPYLGYKSLQSAENLVTDKSFMLLAQEIAYTHHEKWDGTGYPRQLSGEEIPLSGRLMAIADVYDALINKRIYKDAMSHETARKIILEGKGSHFDPELVDIFLEIEDEFLKIAQKFND